MNDLGKKIIFSTYYLIIIFISINNFNNKEFQSLYDFFNDKDKVMHFIQYFILVILAFFTFKIKVNIKNFLLTCFFIMLSSGLAEFIQSYLSARDSSFIDWFYDVLGGVFGFFTFLGISKSCSKK